METNPYFNTPILALFFLIIFVILFADSAQDPLLPPDHPPISAHCGTCPLLCSQPASPSSLSLAGPAGWRHKASCQISDKQLARAEELAESSCWLCCARLLAGAAAASMLLVWKPSPAPRKAALLKSLPFSPLLAYTARTPQVLLHEQERGFPNAVWATDWRKLARNLSDEPKGSENISAAGSGMCEYLHSHSSFLNAGFSLHLTSCSQNHGTLSSSEKEVLPSSHRLLSPWSLLCCRVALLVQCCVLAPTRIG